MKLSCNIIWIKSNKASRNRLLWEEYSLYRFTWQNSAFMLKRSDLFHITKYFRPVLSFGRKILQWNSSSSFPWFVHFSCGCMFTTTQIDSSGMKDLSIWLGDFLSGDDEKCRFQHSITRKITFGIKVGQIDPKWDKSGTFSD